MENAFKLATKRAIARKPATHFDRSVHFTATIKAGTESTIRVAPFLEESLSSLKAFVDMLMAAKDRRSVSEKLCIRLLLLIILIGYLPCPQSNAIILVAAFQTR